MQSIITLLSGIVVFAFMIGFAAYGILGLAITSDQVEALTGVSGFPSIILACLSFAIAPVGLLLCFFGAKDVWGWEWWQALLFTFPGIGVMLAVIFGNAVAAVTDKIRGEA